MSQHADDVKPAGAVKPLLRRIFKTYPKKLWAVLSHNLQWKLLALFLAVCLWVGLILQDPSLTRERVFTGVPLSITGSDTLRRNGFIVTRGLEEANAIVKLKAEVPQHEYNGVSFSNYNPRVDLSRITEAGEQTVKVITSSTTTYGSVTEITPAELPILVDRYITDYRIPVQVSVTGSYPDGFYATAPMIDVSTVAVSGPESIVSKIARIVLDYDASALAAKAGSLQTALPLRYVDIDDNALDPALLEPTSGGVLLRSIIVTQALYPIKSLTLNQAELTAGTPKKGYEIKSVTVSPGVIVAAGDDTTLSTLNALFLDKPVDVTDRDAMFTAEIKVVKPDNIVYLNAETVTLVVDIGPVMETKTFENVPLTINGTPSGLTAATETGKVTVTLTGPMLSMETMKASKVTAFVSAENATAGVFDLPVQLTINHQDAGMFTYTVAPQSVSVNVSGQ